MIPFHNNDVKPVIHWKVEQRLIVRFGPGADDYGILVATPGSQALGLLEVPNSGSSGDFELALSGLLVGTLDLANSVRVSRNGDNITVEVGRPLRLFNTWQSHRVDCSGRSSRVLGKTGFGHRRNL